ncbi:hypothetical protein PIB30_066500 [Stylosanthes scabra]|uniref:Uncharacterized protein n=1 Tax=Stylosanthes scabra TaxID=79078 RepID=A0ABU6UMW7_9FABA|nr:hypothetical protein [Stylosanthes scabra]
MDWVICAPAAFLGCGSRFSGSLLSGAPFQGTWARSATEDASPDYNSDAKATDSHGGLRSHAWCTSLPLTSHAGLPRGTMLPHSGATFPHSVHLVVADQSRGLGPGHHVATLGAARSHMWCAPLACPGATRSHTRAPRDPGARARAERPSV